MFDCTNLHIVKGFIKKKKVQIFHLADKTLIKVSLIIR